MRIIRDPKAMQEEAIALGRTDSSLGFIPTMGALHEGHLSLVRAAREQNDVVIMSIFVNPTQFDEDRDFEKYPREIEFDARLAEEEGVDILFAPTAETMYSPKRDTFVQVGKLASNLCGMSRGRGHFIGVCTVVTKLFNLVRPDRAYFGQKDAQQALIIQRMVIDLNIPVEIVVCPIIREHDGLALSSRNVRIPDEKRESALALRRALVKAREAIRDGERSSMDLVSIMAEEIICDPDVELDYVNIVSLDTLEDVETIDDMVLLAGAIQVGDVRLIDNLILGPDGPWDD